MKQISKKINRKGFTLVETLLAVFILVVVSTMLINGFITTMGYSYQTSIYNKSAGKNYELCMEKVSTWSMSSNNLAGGREEYAETNYAPDGKHKDLTFTKGAYSGNFETLYVGVEKHSTLSPAVPSTLPFQSEAFAPKDDHYVDNRTAIVYFPEYCSQSGAHLGEIVVMLDDNNTPDNTADDHYYWVAAYVKTDDNGEHNPYDATTNRLIKDYDLSYLSDDDKIIEVGVHS